MKRYSERSDSDIHDGLMKFRFINKKLIELERILPQEIFASAKKNLEMIKLMLLVLGKTISDRVTSNCWMYAVVLSDIFDL